MVVYNFKKYNPGIWNLIDLSIFELYQTQKWYMIINLGEIWYKIYPSHAEAEEKIIILNEADPFFQTVTGSMEEDYGYINDHTVIILNNADKILCYLIVEKKLDFKLLLFWKQSLELFIKEENQKISQYPSFLPFFLPHNDVEISKINEAIQKQRKVFFLNGVLGTGKHSFVQNYILYRFFELIDYDQIKNSEMDKICALHLLNNNVEIIIVNELAYLTENDQLVVREKINSEENNLIFICSAYDPVILSNNGVIIPELVDICLKERVIFPSLQRRQHYLRSLLIQYYRWKGFDLLDFLTEEWLVKQSLNKGFNDLIASFKEYLLPQASFLQTYHEKKSIRKVISDIEVLAIEYAIRFIGYSQNKIAKLLGISRGSLQHKLKKYNYPYNEWEE